MRGNCSWKARTKYLSKRMIRHKIIGKLLVYKYSNFKREIFTEAGQVSFLSIRDNVNSLLGQSGAVRMKEGIGHEAGLAYLQMACVDRMVELGELREVAIPAGTSQYNRVFVKA